MATSEKLQMKEILRYGVMPQVVPRFKEIFGTGFYHVAYFIALVYSAVRLLPADHPYVQQSNIGRFGVRHVIAEAANKLEITPANIDKIILFFLVLLGLGIVIAQIALLIGSVFIQSALAADGPFGFFITDQAADDLAFMFMDLVFGVPGVFNSCVSATTAAGTPCVGVDGAQATTLSSIAEFGFPFPIHHAVHQMLSLYSTGLMIIGVMITLYFIVTVLAETAQTGTPFGKRFNKVWAPIRLVVAFALLIPLGYGLNSAQYIVLYMAKFGSSFATNGWIKFNDTLNSENLADVESLVSAPTPPQVTSLLRFVFTAKTCSYLFQQAHPELPAKEQVKAYLIKEGVDNLSDNSFLEIKYDTTTFGTPYTSGGGGSTTKPTALYEFANGAEEVTIVFGPRIFKRDQYGNVVYEPSKKKTDMGAETEVVETPVLEKPEYPGGVWPLCGRMKFKFSDVRTPYPIGASTLDDKSYAEPGIDSLQRYHWESFKRMYFTKEFFGHFEPGGGYVDTVQYLVENSGVGQKAKDGYQFPPGEGSYFPDDAYSFLSNDFAFLLSVDCDDPPDSGDPAGSCGYLESTYRSPQIIPHGSIIDLQKTSSRWDMGDDLRNKGWAAAGIWYNKIAEMNGSLTEAVFNLPQPSNYPIVMEMIADQKRKYNQRPDVETLFKPDTLGDGTPLRYNDLQLNNPDVFASVLWDAYVAWKDIDKNPYNQPTGNAFTDTIQAIFGTEGLYNLRRNHDVHPLAQLVGIGKSLIESSMRNIGYGVASIGVQQVLKNLEMANVAQATKIITSFVASVTMIALTMGFILYYIVPFLPFIYFFFAVVGWVKGIFEALVGVPLWALAHIRIDGNGLPGQAALSGYFLILEIFIRPILTVFGLLASISIFAALIGALGDMWGSLIDNVGGFDVRTGLTGVDLVGSDEKLLNEVSNMGSVLDQFFYTLVYAILVYMIGMSSFKLIDAIPNNILRWMGQSVTAFNDQRQDPAQSMVGHSYQGSTQVTEKLGGVFGA